MCHSPAEKRASLVSNSFLGTKPPLLGFVSNIRGRSKRSFQTRSNLGKSTASWPATISSHAERIADAKNPHDVVRASWKLPPNWICRDAGVPLWTLCCSSGESGVPVDQTRWFRRCQWPPNHVWMVHSRNPWDPFARHPTRLLVTHNLWSHGTDAISFAHYLALALALHAQTQIQASRTWCQRRWCLLRTMGTCLRGLADLGLTSTWHGESRLDLGETSQQLVAPATRISRWLGLFCPEGLSSLHEVHVWRQHTCTRPCHLNIRVRGMPLLDVSRQQLGDSSHLRGPHRHGDFLYNQLTVPNPLLHLLHITGHEIFSRSLSCCIDTHCSRGSSRVFQLPLQIEHDCLQPLYFDFGICHGRTIRSLLLCDAQRPELLQLLLVFLHTANFGLSLFVDSDDPFPCRSMKDSMTRIWTTTDTSCISFWTRWRIARKLSISTSSKSSNAVKVLTNLESCDCILSPPMDDTLTRPWTTQAWLRRKSATSNANLIAKKTILSGFWRIDRWTYDRQIHVPYISMNRTVFIYSWMLISFIKKLLDTTFERRGSNTMTITSFQKSMTLSYQQFWVWNSANFNPNIEIFVT